MDEEFLQFIWKHKLFNKKKYISNNKDEIEIINTGVQNTDSGPDFFNARVKINGTLWAGNVEIHVNSSDWFLHNHHKDNAYNNVILHVVHNNDCDIYRKNKEIIPAIEIEYKKQLYDNYQKLMSEKNTIACKKYIQSLAKIDLSFWLQELAIERLERKCREIDDLLREKDNDWAEVLYYKIASSYGLKINSYAFEQLVRSLPLKILLKHKDNLHQIEALLFGQSGLLNEKMPHNSYYTALQKEYNFLKHKYNLISIEACLWKFMRLRPNNFPTIRLSQFANLIYQTQGLFSKIINTEKINELEKIFRTPATGYWDNHYKFNTFTIQKRTKFPGKQFFYNITINTIIPFLFVYGTKKFRIEYKERAIIFLENLRAENNNIIRQWRDIGIKPQNALESQALIQLKNYYCNENNCLFCKIGQKLILRSL